MQLVFHYVPWHLFCIVVCLLYSYPERESFESYWCRKPAKVPKQLGVLISERYGDSRIFFVLTIPYDILRFYRNHGDLFLGYVSRYLSITAKKSAISQQACCAHELCWISWLTVGVRQVRGQTLETRWPPSFLHWALALTFRLDSISLARTMVGWCSLRFRLKELVHVFFSCSCNAFLHCTSAWQNTGGRSNSLPCIAPAEQAETKRAEKRLTSSRLLQADFGDVPYEVQNSFVHRHIISFILFAFLGASEFSVCCIHSWRMLFENCLSGFIASTMKSRSSYPASSKCWCRKPVKSTKRSRVSISKIGIG